LAARRQVILEEARAGAVLEEHVGRFAAVPLERDDLTPMRTVFTRGSPAQRDDLGAGAQPGSDLVLQPAAQLLIVVRRFALVPPRLHGPHGDLRLRLAPPIEPKAASSRSCPAGWRRAGGSCPPEGSPRRG